MKGVYQVACWSKGGLPPSVLMLVLKVLSPFDTEGNEGSAELKKLSDVPPLIREKTVCDLRPISFVHANMNIYPSSLPNHTVWETDQNVILKKPQSVFLLTTSFLSAMGIMPEYCHLCP